MIVEQAYVPSPLHASGFYKKFGLREYKSIYAPTCFFGAHVSALPVMKAHKGHKTLIWIGMDGYNLSIGKHDVEFVKGCRNIATSKSLQRVLDQNDIVNEYYPITCFNFEGIDPMPLGKKIYFYYGDPGLYNLKTMQEIEKRIDHPVVYVHGWKAMTRKQTLELYKDCFAGIRLREIDGLSNTGIELGLMGRMVIHNGDAPNNVHYSAVDEIVSSIDDIRNVDPDTVSKFVREFIEIGDIWLEIP